MNRAMTTILLALTLPLRTLAQTVPTEIAHVALHAQTTTGATTFHVGERIPLQISFTSTEENQFEINMASYDRSGRMNHETFAVAPSGGWADPLAAYFASGSAGGGLTGFGVLSAKPTTLPLDLNEWVRFDQPGDYTVTIKSSRVSRPGEALGLGSGLSVTSNPVRLHLIEGSSAWQRAKLASILQQLQAVPAGAGMPPKERTEAVADLRYLGTRSAIQELVEALRDDQPDRMYQSALGLIGLPRSMHAFAVEALERKIATPEFPVSEWFLIVLSVLQSGPESSPEVAFAMRQHERDAAWHSVLDALPRKTGKARADTAGMLLGSPPKDLTPESKAQLASVLAASFPDLSEERQTGELLWNWDLLRSDNMLPALRTLATLPLNDPASNMMPDYNRRALKAAALKRWYELDPEGAQRESLAEIATATPSLNAAALAFLPKQPLPEYESVWAQALLHEDNYGREALLLALLVRFGTGAATATVTARLSQKVGTWACEPQGAALAYLVRFNPDVVRPLLQQAIAARGAGKSACNRSVFQDVARYATGAILTESAVATLNDPDPEVVSDAVIYLIDYGDQQAKSPLLTRYTQWTETWSARAAELDHRDPGSPPANWQEAGLGANLGRALIAGQGWIADKQLIADVLSRCVGDQMCVQLGQIATMAEPPFRLSLNQFGDVDSAQLAQYTLKSLDLLKVKIAQYPKGTTFVLVPSLPETNDQKLLEQKARLLVEDAGMTFKVEH